MTSQDDHLNKHLIQGYEQLLQRAEETLNTSAERTEAALKHALSAAREKAVELGELTQEEADKVHDFVTRDLYDAGQHLLQEERELSDWLHLNILVIEKAVLNRFTKLSQAAKLELEHLKKVKKRLDEWHTGEITTIGTLCCKKCGEQIQFKQVGHIPPCPKCHGTVFERVKPS